MEKVRQDSIRTEIKFSQVIGKCIPYGNFIYLFMFVFIWERIEDNMNLEELRGNTKNKCSIRTKHLKQIKDKCLNRCERERERSRKRKKRR